VQEREGEVAGGEGEEEGGCWEDVGLGGYWDNEGDNKGDGRSFRLPSIIEFIILFLGIDLLVDSLVE